MQLPLKTRILQYAIQKNGAFTLHDVMTDLAGEYSGEKIFNTKQVKEYFDSFLGVGFFKVINMRFDEVGELLMTCEVTEYGKEREKYMK